jgi:hypothetical protein
MMSLLARHHLLSQRGTLSKRSSVLSTSRPSSSPLLCLDNRRLGLCEFIKFRTAQFSVSKPISVSPKNRDSRSWNKHN